MSQRCLSMRKLKEVLRLKLDCKLTNRQIARAVSISPSTVSYYVTAFNKSGLSWPYSSTITEQQLIDNLYPHCKQLQSSKERNKLAEPNYTEIHNLLRRKGITLQLLWKEYCESSNKKVYSYSEYCRRYREYKKTISPSMRQVYRYGEKCFVDYAGPKIAIYDKTSKTMREAIIFVGVLGASNYTYVEATYSKSLPDWLGSHTRMLHYFGGVPKLIVPDNEKSGVKDACYYEPDLNPQYAALARHYNCAILPTRPGKPQDKAKVETAVQITERWILAKLRNITFYSLGELNASIKTMLLELNQKPFQKLPGSRESVFNSKEKDCLTPLPSTAYEYADIKNKIVRLDYHLEIDGHYYSVPYYLANKKVEYHLSSNTLQVFYQGLLIASHIRSSQRGHSTTRLEHMPTSHRQQTQWSREKFLAWAGGIGPHAHAIAQYHINNQKHPECCYRIHLGLMNLTKLYSATRFELACKYALSVKTYSFRSIKSILKNHLEQSKELDEISEDIHNITHQNIRGPNYYLKQQEH